MPSVGLKPDIVEHAEFIAMVEHDAVSVVGCGDGRSIGIQQPDAHGQALYACKIAVISYSAKPKR